MEETSLSLLDRLRSAEQDDAWNRLAEVYSPLLRMWLRKYEVQAADVDDLIQEVLMAVSRGLGSFEHAGQTGSFRSWLRTILVHRLRNFWRTRARRPAAHAGADIEPQLAELEDPTSKLTGIWNRQHDQHVLQQLLALAQPQFEPKTWQAFRQVALEGIPPKAVAKNLDMSLNSVFIAKSRILSRLRREAEGLVDSSSGFPAKG